MMREAAVWTSLKHNNVLEFCGIVEGSEFGALGAFVSPVSDFYVLSLDTYCLSGVKEELRNISWSNRHFNKGFSWYIIFVMNLYLSLISPSGRV